MRGPQIILQTHDMILQILFIKYINYSFIYWTSSVGENRNEQNMNEYVDLPRFMTKYDKCLQGLICHLGRYKKCLSLNIFIDLCQRAVCSMIGLGGVSNRI